MSYQTVCLYNKFKSFDFHVDEIREYIGTFLFQRNDLDKSFFNIWKEKMKETLSIIDKGWKYVPIYKINNQITFCVDCYLNAFLEKKSYSNIECFGSCRNILYYGGEFLGRKMIDFNHIKITTNFQPKFFMGETKFDKSCRILLNSSKFLSEENISFSKMIPYALITKNDIDDLFYEIKFGPISWNSNLEQKSILLKKYSNSYEEYKHPISSCIFSDEDFSDLYPISY